MRNKRTLICVLMLLCMMMLSATAFAGYSSHLGGDSNFILCDGHMGTAWYVDRSSLNVQQYAPPEYTIAVNVCTVPNADQGNTAISKVSTMRFFYNYNARSMFIDRNGSWRHLNPNGSWAETGITMPAGEIAFYLAYHMRFYNCYDNAFYNRI